MSTFDTEESNSGNTKGLSSETATGCNDSVLSIGALAISGCAVGVAVIAVVIAVIAER